MKDKEINKWLIGYFEQYEKDGFPEFSNGLKIGDILNYIERVTKKAKAYDESLERAREWYNKTEPDSYTCIVESIFPELAESEDEEIRKWVINEIKIKHHNLDEENVDFVDKAIAWLEKQGEQKEYSFKSIPRLLDMIEPSDRAKAYCQKLIDTLAKEGYNTDAKIVEGVLKGWNGEDVPMAVMDEKKPVDKSETAFHDGDWVVDEDDNSVHQIKCVLENVTSGNFSYDLVGGGYFPSTKKNYHLWSIDDAQDGDVLALDVIENYPSPFVAIFKEFQKDNFEFDSYCFIGHDGVFYEGEEGHSIYEIHPATKEQRDILFKKMKENGYEWDDKEKKLIKIEVSLPSFDEQQGTPIIDIPFGAKDSEFQEASYHIPEGFHAEIDGNKVVIKKGEKNLTWDEGDDAYKLFAIAAVEDYYDRGNPLHKDLVDWLQSLENRVITQPKEWSEEDKQNLKTILFQLRVDKTRAHTPHKLEAFDKLINWLEELKDRFVPKQWKPTQKQLTELRCVISGCSFNTSVLVELEKQLKAL